MCEQNTRHTIGFDGGQCGAYASRWPGRVRLSKDTHDLGFEFREFDGEHRPARMEDQVEAGGKQIHVTAQHFAHAALDAIALVGLAEHLAGGEPNARPWNRVPACGARNQLMEADWRLRLAA